MRKALTTLIIMGTAIASPAVACSPEDIKIKQANSRPRDVKGFADIVGEITNTCDEAVDAKLHFVFRDATGKVSGVTDDWVTSGRINIPPHSEYAFSKLVWSIGDARTMSATVIDDIGQTRIKYQKSSLGGPVTAGRHGYGHCAATLFGN